MSDPSQAQPPTALEAVLRAFSAGELDRRAAEEQTGLSYGEILLELGRHGLSRPIVRTFPMMSDAQKALYNEVFRPDPH